jgi:non-ribosomal peptide synthetase-like protein
VLKNIEKLANDPAMPAPFPQPRIDKMATAESGYAEVLAGVLGVDEVEVGSNFFDDLDADSMVMARFCAWVRKREDLPTVSMKDIYRNPTIRGLAAAHARPGTGDPGVVELSGPATGSELVSVGETEPIGTARYLLCGALQLLYFLGYAYLLASIASCGYEWISASSGSVDQYLRVALTGGPARGYGWLSTAPGVGWIYLRAVTFSAASFIVLCALPIAAKWALIGRWRPCEIRIWSVAYFWFWLVKTLIRSSPLVLFAGSPIYVFYLRALGAKIGRGATILSRNVPVCTDLLTVGAGTVIRKDSSFNCYRAHGGVIQTGPVTLGDDVLVSEATVLDIGTTMGTGSQLGHASALHTGQAVPHHQRWHGSPAQPTEVDYRSVEPARCGMPRRAVYSILQLTFLTGVTLPVPVGAAIVVLRYVPQLGPLLDGGPVALKGWPFYLTACVVSLVVFLGGLVVALLGSATVPRVANLLITPNRVYRLYGVRYWVHQGVARMTNIATLNQLFGDSSYIVGYLRRLGYNLSHVEQTGSNFGQQVKHDNPYLSTVGSGTMVADGLSFINASYSSTSFQVSRVAVGAHSFLGNNIAYPAQAKVGENCLLGTKVMVPIDGDIRHGVGLLGSPSFEIPRTVERDIQLDIADADERGHRLTAKNRHNIVTMVLFLAVRWFNVFGLILLAACIPSFYPSLGVAAAAADLLVGSVLTVCYGLLVDRACRGLLTWAPAGCSIYDARFWRHERFWKVPIVAYLAIFNGTPFKGTIWRLLGVRIGAKVFDDGCGIVEKSFVTIGDHCTLNAGSVIQCHSQEDGAFKSDRTSLGIGCTLAVGAFVHYGVTMCDGATLEADAFLMKGEQVPGFTRWGGNPAAELRPSAWPAPPAPPESSLPPLALLPGAVVGRPQPVQQSPRPSPLRASPPLRTPEPTPRALSILPAPALMPTLPTPPPAPGLSSPHLVTAKPALAATPTPLAAVVRPRVNDPLPGPRSVELLATQDRDSPTGMDATRLPFVVSKALGSFVDDVDGNTFIDFAGSDALGHNHPELISAVAERLGRFASGLNTASSARHGFTVAQLSMLPESMRDRMRIQLCPGVRPDAVHTALRLSRLATGREEVVSLTDAVTASHAESPVPGVRVAPIPSCGPGVTGQRPGSCQGRCAEVLDRELNASTAGLPAALVISMLGDGQAPAHHRLVHRARELTRELAIPLVVDETATGAGRTGTWFGFEHYDIEPDVIIAEASVGGLVQPLGYVLHDAQLPPCPARVPELSANELAFVAGQHTAEIIRRDNVLAHAREQGKQLALRLADIGQHPAIHEVRGLGLQWTVEFTSPGDTRSATELAQDVHARALRGGLILRLDRDGGPTIQLRAPLTVSGAVVDTASTILSHAIEQACTTPGRADASSSTHSPAIETTRVRPHEHTVPA